ncbi:MAG: hypothetical protein SGPRY_013109, partial [Prymnesium sp.]
MVRFGVLQGPPVDQKVRAIDKARLPSLTRSRLHLQLYFEWVPSAANASDLPSRANEDGAMEISSRLHPGAHLSSPLSTLGSPAAPHPWRASSTSMAAGRLTNSIAQHPRPHRSAMLSGFNAICLYVSAVYAIALSS